MNSKILLASLSVFALSFSACTNKCSVKNAAAPSVMSSAESDAFGGKSSVYFGFDRSDLTEKAKERVNSQAKVLKSANKGAVVEGHTDERGTADYNIALGMKRAESVKKQLNKEGVKEVVTVSYGKERPAISNASSEEEHARNRRTVTKIQD